jgi:hydroxymethylbilane synthase
MVRGAMRARGIEAEIVVIKTSGDRGDRDRLGAFVREIQEALLAGTVDCGLHCLKDLPTEGVAGLRLSAFLTREDPRDALISPGVSLDELPRGAVVGTGSVRRTSQLAAGRPDLAFRRLVGNVDTRLRKVWEGEYAAIVLAMAGLNRLGLKGDVLGGLRAQPLETDVMLPAPGQAILVLETRAGDDAAMDSVAFLDDADTRACAVAERAFLRTFGGGCSVPVGALAVPKAGDLRLDGIVASPDGRQVLRGTSCGLIADAERIGERLGREIGVAGGFEIVTSVLREREAVR